MKHGEMDHIAYIETRCHELEATQRLTGMKWKEALGTIILPTYILLYYTGLRSNRRESRPVCCTDCSLCSSRGRDSETET